MDVYQKLELEISQLFCKLIVKLSVGMRHAYDVRLILDHGRPRSVLREDLDSWSYITKYHLRYYTAGYVNYASSNTNFKFYNVFTCTSKNASSIEVLHAVNRTFDYVVIFPR
jgi:hypothetical protein